MSKRLLRDLVKEVLMSEIDVGDVEDVCYTAGSTHVMKTCRIGGNKYFLKFSEEDLFEEGFHPSLQILIEYLAYRIYGLFSGINIPTPELVYDKKNDRVGLATTPASGKQALKVGMSPKSLGKMMTQGVYVDIFLANWDAVGTGSGNVFVDKDKLTRIDPGGSLTFRAQGGRKGSKFGPRAGDLDVMLKGDKGAGLYFRHSDLKTAAKEFLAVTWDSILTVIDDVESDISKELKIRGMKNLSTQWRKDVKDIKNILEKRHEVVSDHAKHVLDQ